MTEIEKFKDIFESAFVGLLNNWRVWLGDDELRAIHIGFDSANTEISISLLTDREPYLDESDLSAFGQKWSTGNWRLSCVNATYGHQFPDASEIMEWMEKKSYELTDDELAGC